MKVYLVRNSYYAGIIKAVAVGIGNTVTSLVLGTASTTTPSGTLVFDSHDTTTYPPNAFGSGSLFDADMIDGKHASDFTPIATVSSTNSAIGWIRVAQSTVDINRNHGIFEIMFAGSGAHGRKIFTAGVMFGQDSTVDMVQLSGSSYANGISQARIIYNTSFTGNYAYLELYFNTATAITFSVKGIDLYGWSLITPTSGSIPSGYTSKTLDMSYLGISALNDVRINGNRAMCIVAPPASASSTGTAGQIAYDSGYVYICVAANTWKRAALSTW